MDNHDRQAIEGLFSRLGEAERQTGQRDAEAEAFIKERVAKQPSAPYLMAQTIVVQEYALQEAQRRIEELERRRDERPSTGGGFLSGILGSGSNAVRPSGAVPAVPRGPVASAAPVPPGRGGGFLAGAAQTAMGVAGGLLLGNAIAGMLGVDEAQAAEAPAPVEPEPSAAEPAAAEGGGFFENFFGGGEDDEV